MDCCSVVVILERATWGESRALPQSESHRERRLQSVVVCYDSKCPTLVKYGLEHVFIIFQWLCEGFWVIRLIGFMAMSFVLTEKTHIFVLFLTNDLCL
jgi:hypothetical protein